jgi:hypothetical protein
MTPEPLEPSAWCLFESVEGLRQEAHMVGLLFVDEAGRLLAVDTFKKLPMKKHILHIQLVHRPVVRGGEVKDCPDHGGFDDRGECLIEVDPRSLV